MSGFYRQYFEVVSAARAAASAAETFRLAAERFDAERVTTERRDAWLLKHVRRRHITSYLMKGALDAQEQGFLQSAGDAFGAAERRGLTIQ